MIGLALHLAARGLDTVRAEMAEARSLLGWGLAFVALGRGTPDPSEVDQLGAECDALRAERDEARARVAELRGILRESRALTHEAEGERDDARTLAHEAKLELSAAREACEQLRGELATARRERLEALQWRGVSLGLERKVVEAGKERDELRRRVLDAVDTRERLETSDAAAEETGGIKRLDLLVEAMEAWNKLVEAVTP